MADIQPPDSPQSSGGLNNILNDTADDIHIFDADDDDNTKEENIVRRHAQHVVPAVSPPRPTITSASNKNAPLSPTGKSPPVSMISVHVPSDDQTGDDAASVVSSLATPKYSATNPIIEAAMRSQRAEEFEASSAVPTDRQEAYKQAIILALKKRQELEDDQEGGSEEHASRSPSANVYDASPTAVGADVVSGAAAAGMSPKDSESPSTHNPREEANSGGIASATISKLALPTLEVSNASIPSKPNPYAGGVNNSSSSSDEESDMRSGAFPVNKDEPKAITPDSEGSNNNVSILVDTTTGDPISTSKENGAYRPSSPIGKEEAAEEKEASLEGILSKQPSHQLQLVDYGGGDGGGGGEDSPQDENDDSSDDYDVIPLVREPTAKRNQPRFDANDVKLQDPSSLSFTPSTAMPQKFYDDEDDFEDDDRRRKLRNLMICGMIGLAIVVAGAVIAGIFIMQERNSDGDDDGDLATPVPTIWTPSNNSKTDAPTLVDKLSLMVSSILLRNISDPYALLLEPESSQYQALHWLVYDDPWFQLTISILADIDGSHEDFEDRLSDQQVSDKPSAFTLTMDVLAERYALAVLYLETDGPGWFRSGDWLSEKHVCTWHGVSCFEAERITSDVDGDNRMFYFRFTTTLDLHDEWEGGNGLHGSIPGEIGFLSRLHMLDLGGQEGCSNSTVEEDCPQPENPRWIAGEIPTEIGFLSQLTSLNLRDQHLVGTIPRQAIQSLTSLTTLDISRNLLSGNIPMQIGALKSLSHLYLYDNILSGAMPSEIGRLAGNLTEIDLSMNQLAKPLPSDIGLLTSLRVLALGNNGISGRVPSEVGTMASLTDLFLQHNKLTGAIPANISDVSTLNTLDLSFNDLSSSMPSEIGQLSELVYLYLQNNTLTGTVPRLIKGLYNLFELNIENNDLEGSINSIFCEQATDFTRLKRGQFPTLYNLCVGGCSTADDTCTNTTIQCNCCVCR